MISESVLIELIREVSRNTRRIDDLPRPEVGSGGSAPADAEYLVNAASDGLTNEIVVTAASGYIIRGHDPGAGVTWEDYDASTEGAVLIGDGTDIISDTTPTFVDVVSFDANTRVLDGNELQFYDVGDSNYVGFEAPALTANQIWVLPNADGGANEFLQTDGAGNLTWAGGAGGTDLTGLGTNDRIARWNGTDTIQDSLVTLDDSGNIQFVNDDLYIGRSGDVRIKFDSSNGYIDAILDDAAGSDRWRIIDSGAVEVAYIDSNGNAQFDGDVTAANFYGADGTEFGISGNELLTVNTAGTFAFSGISGVTVEDEDWIGNGAASARLVFDSSGATDYAYFDGCQVGIAVTTPDGRLHANDGIADLVFSNRVGGVATLDLRRDDNSILAGNVFGRIAFRGNDTTDNAYITHAEIIAIARGTHSAGDNPTALDFYTTDDSSETATFRMRIDKNGRVGINETLPDYRLDVDGVIGVSDNAGDPSTVTDKATFYGKDVGGTVEAFAQDEAGNAAQLTPHNYAGPVQPIPGTLHWSQYHANHYAGVEKWYDIERALLKLEELTGEQFIYAQAIERRVWTHKKLKPRWMRERITK